jgi:uncharacterized damage-inducible protein DinB
MENFFEVFMERLQELHTDFEATISGLSIQALDWVPGADMNSLCVLVVHTVGAARFMMSDVVCQTPSGRDRAAEFTAHGLDEAALRQKLAENRAYIRQTLETLTLENLSEMRLNPRNNRQQTVGDMVLHVLDHTALHLGHAQITRQLWDQRK